jgi:2-iminobutanoate/2-iminopropanoate deaminase
VRQGDWLFISGQGPFDPASGEILGTSIGEQTRRTLENLKSILAAEDFSPRCLVKVTAHIESFDLFGEFNASYRESLTAPFPARTTVESGLGGILVEVDAIAYRVPRRWRPRIPWHG